MPLITLTTDLGIKDYYLAVLKGKILSKQPQVNIVDISNEIAPFNIQEAAFILKNSFLYFPDNTIHLVSVHAENKPSLKCVALRYKNQFFTGLDNGLFSLIFDDYPEKIIEIPRDIHKMSTFIAKDLLCDVACDIASGKKIETLGRQLQSIETKTYLRPPDNAYVVKANIVYVDRFGNVIVNISKSRFEKIRDGRKFSINYKKQDVLTEIKNTYSDVPDGERVCLFNSEGYLEIAINRGNAEKLLGLHVDDVIQIEFE